MKRVCQWLNRLALRLGKAVYNAEKDPVKKHRLAKYLWEFKRDIGGKK